MRKIFDKQNQVLSRNLMPIHFFRQIVVAFFIAITLFPMLVLPAKVNAVNERGWSLIFKPQDRTFRIRHTVNDSTTIEFAQQDGESQDGLTMWASVGTAIQPKLWVMTYHPSEIIENDVIKSATIEIKDTCISKTDLDPIRDSSNDTEEVTLDYNNNRQVKYYCFNGQLDGGQNVPSHWFEYSLPTIYSNATTRGYVAETIRSLFPDILVKLQYVRPGKPLDANIESCKSTIVTPLFAGMTNTKIKQHIEEMKSTLAADPANKDDMDVINQYFDDSALPERLKSLDLGIYTQFYSTKITNPYPDIVLADNLQKKLAEDFMAIGQPLSNDAADWSSETLDLVATGIAQLGVFVQTGGNVWATGATGFGALIAIRRAQGYILTGNATTEIKSALDGYIKLYLESYYLVANNNFNQCLADKGDPYAYTNTRLAKAAASLQNQSTGVGANTSTGSSGVCGSISFNSIGDMGGLIRIAICNVALLIHEFATSFVDGAIKAFEKTIGLEAGY